MTNIFRLKSTRQTIGNQTDIPGSTLGKKNMYGYFGHEYVLYWFLIFLSSAAAVEPCDEKLSFF